MKKILILASLLACAGAASAQQREYVMPGHQTHRDNWGYYVTKYQDAEKALACAGFVGLNPRQVGGGAKPVDYIPHPAVKHAAEVDAPVRGRGPKLCSYIEQPQNKKWYADNFGIRPAR